VIKGLIEEEEIDAVVASHVLAGTAAVKAAKKCGVPTIFDLKDWFPDSAASYYKNPVLKWTLRNGVWQITKYNLGMSDQITTVSPSLVERLNDRGFDAKLITNGVNTDYFKPMDSVLEKRRLGLDEDDFVIGFSGSVERWYALDQVIKSFAKISEGEGDLRLLVVGGSLFTDYDQELEKLTKKLGIEDKVVFSGLVEYEELPSYISAMDLCLIPLLPDDWVDIALPNKFFEYSACGKPILSTPIPDMIKIGGENLFIYRDMKEFSDKVLEIKNSPRSFEVDMTNYSWKRKAREMETIIANLVAGKNR
jgi:Glycosyltransferase